MPDTVTILTPTLNAARWLPACIRSIEAQTVGRARIEHVVLDGASSDDTAGIARAAGSTVDAARDGSLYQALNRGISLARGEIIGWLNADDTLEPGAIERVLRRFDETGAEMVIGDYAVARGERVRIVRTPPDALVRIRRGARRTVWVTPLAVFFRARTLRGLGPYLSALRIAADLDMWLRAAARTPAITTAHTGTVIGRFTMHADSLSAGARAEPVISETLQVARSWAEDASSPPGVRRHALYLARINAMKLVRERSRARSLRSRASSMRAEYEALARAGPGALWDIRGEIYEFAAEALGLLRGERRRATE